MRASIEVINEVSQNTGAGWTLCFQWCRYNFDDPEADAEHGYRFIWRDPENRLRPQMGQARIPSIRIARELMQQARRNGWGEHDGDAS